MVNHNLTQKKMKNIAYKVIAFKDSVTKNKTDINDGGARQYVVSYIKDIYTFTL